MQINKIDSLLKKWGTLRMRRVFHDCDRLLIVFVRLSIETLIDKTDAFSERQEIAFTEWAYPGVFHSKKYSCDWS